MSHFHILYASFLEISSCVKALFSGIYIKETCVDARHGRLFTSVDAWAVAVVTPPSCRHSQLSYVTFYLLCSFTSSDLGWCLPPDAGRRAFWNYERRANVKKKSKHRYFDITHKKRPLEIIKLINTLSNFSPRPSKVTSQVRNSQSWGELTAADAKIRPTSCKVHLRQRKREAFLWRGPFFWPL